MYGDWAIHAAVCSVVLVLSLMAFLAKRRLLEALSDQYELGGIFTSGGLFPGLVFLGDS